MTTLYFEAEREDDLPVDRAGFPLQVGCWQANKAETTTIIPIVEAFQAAHGIEDLIIVADAGMLSAANLTALDDARLRFIAWGPHHPGPRRPGGSLPLARGRPRRRPGHRHRHPQAGLAE